jgi:hypothetical protein
LNHKPIVKLGQLICFSQVTEYESGGKLKFDLDLRKPLAIWQHVRVVPPTLAMPDGSADKWSSRGCFLTVFNFTRS